MISQRFNDVFDCLQVLYLVIYESIFVIYSFSMF